MSQKLDQLLKEIDETFNPAAAAKAILQTVEPEVTQSVPNRLDGFAEDKPHAHLVKEATTL